MQKGTTDAENQPSIEDLTLDEIDTENVKGGVLSRGGVEREMKESGEKLFI